MAVVWDTLIVGTGQRLATLAVTTPRCIVLMMELNLDLDSPIGLVLGPDTTSVSLICRLTRPLNFFYFSLPHIAYGMFYAKEKPAPLKKCCTKLTLVLTAVVDELETE